MASEESGGSLVASAVNLLGSTALRNATLTCLAAAGVALTVRSLLSSQGDDGHPPAEGQGKRRGKKSHVELPERRNEDMPHALDRNYGQPSRSRRDSSSTVEHETSTMFSPSSRRLDRGFSGSSSSKNVIAIFWDVDNCSPNTGASGHQVAQAIRRAAQSAGPDPDRLGSIVSFKAYLELSSESSTPNAAQVQLRSELQGSGVSLIDTPKSGRKDVADKMMIADLLSFAIDKRPPALIVLLSGDRDFAYPLGILRNRGYEILLITPPTGATPILEASANYKLRWRQDVLKLDYDAHGRPYDTAPRVNGTQKASNTEGASTAVVSSTAQTATMKKAQSTDLIPEAVKGPNGKKVPPVFAPLVTVLEQFAQEGTPAPLRSRVSVRLQALDNKVFDKAHASGWSEYVAVAEAAGIVAMGPGPQMGREWISLPGMESTEHQGWKNKKWEDATAGELGIFAPLIEVHRNLRRGAAAGRDPTVREMNSELDDMVRRGVAGRYTHTGTGAFDNYIKQAFKARVARLAPSDIGTVVQLYPKYQDTSIAPDAPSSESVDGSPPPASQPAVEPHTNKVNTSSPVKATAALPSTPKVAFVANAKCFAHQPSGEVISVAYFPLANFLLTQRSEGDYSTRETMAHQHLNKHHRLGRSIQSWPAFQEYLRSAVTDDVVKVVLVDGVRHIILADRLCKGEGGDRHKGFVRGQNGSWRRESVDASSNSDEPKQSHPSSSPRQEPRATVESNVSQIQASTEPSGSADGHTKVEEVLATLQTATSEQFNTKTATADDRQKFKALVDALVSLRKRGMARAVHDSTKGTEMEPIVLSAVMPLRGAVATALVEVSANAANDASEGTALTPVKAPGAWLQALGYASFSDYYDEAERKGFVHLVSHEGRERVRLAKRYEEMFFPA